jgi:hypothetical protein
VYKLLNYVQPDLILMQMKPDKLLSNIFHLKSLDVNTLIRKPFEIQPSLSYKTNSIKELKKNGIIIADRSSKNNILQEQYKEVSINERITPEAMSMIALWGEEKNTDILLADMPEAFLIERISNKYSLMQIRQMFQEAFIQFPNNPDFEPHTPLGTAITLFPDVFIAPSDSFIAQTINNIKKHKRVVAFVGYGQTRSLPLYLKHDLATLDSLIKAPPRYDSLITGEDTLEVLVEKWALLYLIIYGVEKCEKFTSNDANVLDLITKYAKDDVIRTGFNQEGYMIDRMKHLFDNLMQEKVEVALDFIGDGYELKKKTFMKKIYDDPYYNTQLL